MKKSAVVAGVVIVLGVAYVGSSWYVGKKAQDTIEQVVAQDNKEFLKMLGPDSGLTLAIDDYKRGVFSSYPVYHLRFTDNYGKPIVLKSTTHPQRSTFPAT